MHREDEVLDEEAAFSRVADRQRRRQERQQKEHRDRQVADELLEEAGRVVEEFHHRAEEYPDDEMGRLRIDRRPCRSGHRIDCNTQ